MKIFKVIVFLLVLIIPVIVLFENKDSKTVEYFRIHIRANSNSETDQNIKYIIKEKVVDYITPFLVNAKNKKDAMDIVKSEIGNIEAVCDDILAKNGFDYISKGLVEQEYFPTRQYEEYVLSEGKYDALILNLGSGDGDNWWCVIYPPLCFVNKNCETLQDIIYKSKLLEIIERFFKR